MTEPGRTAGRWRRWGTALAAALAIAGGMVVSATRDRIAVAGDDPAPQPSPWRDQALLEKRLAEACDAVEHVCGAKFEKRPTVRVSEREDVAKILKAELAQMYDESEKGLRELAEGSIPLVSRALLAKYEPGRHAIHVLAANVEGVESVLGRDGKPTEDLLRIVLAHEVTHALDWPRFSLEEKRTARATQAARQALNAVVEGHAQWVAEQVAWTWGLTRDFERFTKSLTELPEIENPVSRQVAKALAAEMAFAYVQGLAFMKAVAKAGGRERIEAALKAPPDSTRWIEHAEEWIANSGRPAGQEPDLDAAVESFRFLVGDPAWTVVATRVSEALLKSQASEVPEEKRADFLRGWVDGRVLIGMVPPEGRQVMALVALFREDADAASFVALERATSEAKAKRFKEGPITVEKAEYEEGAGPGGRLPGYVAHTVVAVGSEKAPTDSVAFSIGRIGVEVLIVNSPEIDRKAQDAAVERLEAYLADPVAFAALPKPESVVIARTTRTVEVAILDPDGQAVPRARVRTEQEGRGPPDDPIEVQDGVARLTVKKGAVVRVSIWGARDAAGAPLPLAPKDAVDLPTDEDRAAVRLEPGAAIEGTVVDEAGNPVEGATVEAAREEDGPRFPVGVFAPGYGVVHGEATSGADGTFRVVGLSPRAPYRLTLSDAKAGASEAVSATSGDTGVRLTLRAGLTVTLTIVGPDDRPVVGAHVSVFGWRSAQGSHRGPPDTMVDERTNAAGRATFHGLTPTGDYSLDVTPLSGDIASHYAPGWKPGDARIRLEKGWTARGVVVDENDRPVRAEVWNLSGRRSSSVETDPQGRFTLRNLPAGPVRLGATLRNVHHGPPGLDDRGVVEATPERPEVTLRLPSTATLTIRVLDPAGMPAASAEVWVDAGRRSWSVRYADGKATTDRASGPVRVIVGHARAADGTRLAPAERRDVPADVAEVELRLEAGLSISGLVVDDGGAPVRGAAVSASPAEAGSGPSFRLWAGYPRDQADATTDADGAFRIEGLARGEHRVEVVRVPEPFVAPEPVTVASGSSDLRIVVRKGAAADVTVLDWNSAPLAGARVKVIWMRPTGPGSYLHVPLVEALTDAKGVFRLPPTDPARALRLTLEPPDGRDDVMRFEEEEWRPKAGEPIRVPRGYVVSGVVRDGLGRPVRATLHRRTTRKSGWTVEQQAGESDSDGTFRLRGLPYGQVSLRAVHEGSSGGLARGGDWVEATPENPKVEVILRSGAGSTGEVKVHVPGARSGRTGTLFLEVGKGEESKSFGLRFDDDGNALARGVPAAKYSVWIPAQGEGDRRICFRTGVAVRGSTVELEMTEGSPVRFRVTLPERAQVDSVEVIGPLGYAIEAEDVGEGHYVVPALPPGTWKVKVRAYLGQKELNASADATAGGDEIVVEPK